MYQAGGTIKQLLDKLASNIFVLPAIQREFVWKPEQICCFFDSLLQGYPFGTFLFWKIAPENKSLYQFYQVMQHYHERDNAHCHRITDLPSQDVSAVLDGQQRITALNIGLRGSYAWKLPGKWKTNNEAFPTRHLYLNLLGHPDQESGLTYHFEFLNDEKAQHTDSIYWFLCSRVLSEDEDKLIDELDEFIPEKDSRLKARKTLRKLIKAIHDQDKISFFEETDQNLDKVLNIFIRLNSGGTQLSYSDLLLSIAVAQWENLDARKEIHSLVDEMNKTGRGFSFSKDLVLKAGLMLSDIGSVGFKVENFNKKNMAILENNWKRIRKAILLTINLLSSFGFSSSNLRANSAILPICYYVYSRNLDHSYLHKRQYANDRQTLKNWLLRSLLKPSGIWGSGLDTLLTALRTALQQDTTPIFPTQQIEKVMLSKGKSMRFEDEEIAELAELPYGNSKTFPLLSLLFDGIDSSLLLNVDHIYPKEKFGRKNLLKAGINEDQIENYQQKMNNLPNLQLIEASLNNEKSSMMPKEWFESRFPDQASRDMRLSALAITTLPTSISDFHQFYSERHNILIQKIKSILTSTDNNTNSNAA